MKRYIVALTGASGIIYGIRLVEELLKAGFEVHLIVSDPACTVIKQELNWKLDEEVEDTFRKLLPGNLYFYKNYDIGAGIASGSFLTEAMIVIPCSMSSISNIAHGTSKNLVERAADVMLKEKRRLIVVPRETPLSSIHLRNMLLLSEMGVHVVPAMPGFYHRPQTLDEVVDFVVGKVMDAMNIPHSLFQRYK